MEENNNKFKTVIDISSKKEKNTLLKKASDIKCLF